MGRLAIIGGQSIVNPIESKSFSYGGERLPSYLEVNNPNSGTWQGIGFPTGGARCAIAAAGSEIHAFTTYPADRIGEHYYYDLNTGEWERSDVPGPNVGLTGSASCGDKIVLLYTNYPAYIYDNTTKTASRGVSAAPYTLPRSLAVLGTEVHWVGANASAGSNHTHYIYDVETDTYATQPGPPTSIPLTTSIPSVCAGEDGDTMYVASPPRQVNGGSIVYFARYTKSSGAWTSMASVQYGEYDQIAIAVADGVLHAMGGKSHSGTYATNSNAEYVIATNTWRTGSPMPNTTYGVYGISLHGDVFTGDGNQSTFASPAPINRYMGNDRYTLLTDVSYNQQVAATTQIFHLDEKGELTTIDAREGYQNITKPGTLLARIGTPVDGAVRRIS